MGRTLKLVAGLVTALASSTLLLAAWQLKRKVRRAGGCITLRNSAGAEVVICTIGAAIQRLIVPDLRGRREDVVLGYTAPEDYKNSEPVTYFGVVVGRVANRIANAKFKVDGKEYPLVANNGPNALHGGAGLHKRTWTVINQQRNDEYSSVVLEYVSPDGEEGYPGQLRIQVSYRLAEHRNALTCTFTATTTHATPVNLAQHSYFNLAGQSSGQTCLDHMVRIPTGDHYTPVGPTSIPTGDIAPVAGTAFDFLAVHTIRERISQVPGGYDHNYVLFNQGAQARFITKGGMVSVKPKLAASVYEPKSGRLMELLTTAPGMQFYSGNFLDETVKGKGGVHYFKNAGFCMETQAFPDAVNQPNFPSVILRPEETYTHTVVFSFTVANSFPTA